MVKTKSDSISDSLFPKITVGRLIEILKELNQDAEVEFWFDDVVQSNRLKFELISKRWCGEGEGNFLIHFRKPRVIEQKQNDGGS